MALDFTQMKADMAEAIADAIAQATGDNFSTLEVTALGIPATWNGTTTVTCPDTSQVVSGNFVKATKGSVAGPWWQVDVVTEDVSFTIIDFFGIVAGGGSIPTGGAPSDLSQTLVWDGTNIVTTTDTSGIAPGDSIRLNSDGQFFFVQKVVTNTSVQIADGGLTIPTGSTTSSIANSSRTAQKLPSPPDGADLVSTIGEPVAHPVVDEGIEVLSTSPHELPSYTVAGAGAISSPATGSMIYVTNEVGGAVPAFYDGTNWRRCTDRSIIST